MYYTLYFVPVLVLLYLPLYLHCIQTWVGYNVSQCIHRHHPLYLPSRSRMRGAVAPGRRAAVLLLSSTVPALPTGPRLDTAGPSLLGWHCQPELDNTGPSLRTADPSLTLLARACHYRPEVDICDPPELHVTTVQSRHDSTACTTTVYWPELAH